MQKKTIKELFDLLNAKLETIAAEDLRQELRECSDAALLAECQRRWPKLGDAIEKGLTP